MIQFPYLWSSASDQLDFYVQFHTRTSVRMSLWTSLFTLKEAENQFLGDCQLVAKKKPHFFTAKSFFWTLFRQRVHSSVNMRFATLRVYFSAYWKKPCYSLSISLCISFFISRLVSHFFVILFSGIVAD